MSTYLAVVAFHRDRAGRLVPGAVIKAPTLEAATRRALELSFKRAGALAFQRSVDPRTGLFDRGEVIAAYGEVDARILLGDDSLLVDP